MQIDILHGGSLLAPCPRAGVNPLTGVCGMNLMETALYKLASEGKISLEQAKILNAIRKKRAVHSSRMAEETGEDLVSLTPELFDLEERKIIEQKNGIYYCEDFEMKISELIRKEETEKIETKIRAR